MTLANLTPNRIRPTPQEAQTRAKRARGRELKVIAPGRVGQLRSSLLTLITTLPSESRSVLAHAQELGKPDPTLAEASIPGFPSPLSSIVTLVLPMLARLGRRSLPTRGSPPPVLPRIFRLVSDSGQRLPVLEFPT